MTDGARVIGSSEECLDFCGMALFRRTGQRAAADRNGRGSIPGLSI